MCVRVDRLPLALMREETGFAFCFVPTRTPGGEEETAYLNTLVGARKDDAEPEPSRSGYLNARRDELVDH